MYPTSQDDDIAQMLSDMEMTSIDDNGDGVCSFDELCGYTCLAHTPCFRTPPLTLRQTFASTPRAPSSSVSTPSR